MFYKKIFNVFGEDITGKEPKLASPSFGTVGEDGIEMPDYKTHTNSEISDENGFDKRYKKEYEHITKGTILCRYGSEGGNYTTVRGTPYNKLGLPWDIRTREYHEYKVISDTLYSWKGIVAPAFASEGGGIQFFHKETIADMIDNGDIKETMDWIK